MIISLNPDSREHVEAAVKLHKELLHDSPIVLLGDFFMKKFYYTSLVKDELFLCDLFYFNGKYVGFISYTKDPLHFMQKGLKKNFIRLFFVLLISIIRKPAIVKTILKTVQEMSQRESSTYRQDQISFGEVLSIGVAKDNLPVVDKKSGKRIPNLLFDRAIEYFRKQTIKRYRLSVTKDNKAALLFYLSYGGKIIDNQCAGGKSYQLEFSIG
tara:strand:+ start:4036 stop:4671 length:636 start_codon:yes stop_codon:yes gene_type:complete